MLPRATRCSTCFNGPEIEARGIVSVFIFRLGIGRSLVNDSDAVFFAFLANRIDTGPVSLMSAMYGAAAGCSLSLAVLRKLHRHAFEVIYQLFQLTVTRLQAVLPPVAISN